MASTSHRLLLVMILILQLRATSMTSLSRQPFGLKLINAVANAEALEILASLGSYIYDQNNRKNQEYVGHLSVAFVAAASIKKVNRGELTSDGRGTFKVFMILLGDIRRRGDLYPPFHYMVTTTMTVLMRLDHSIYLTADHLNPETFIAENVLKVIINPLD